MLKWPFALRTVSTRYCRSRTLRVSRHGSNKKFVISCIVCLRLNCLRLSELPWSAHYGASGTQNPLLGSSLCRRFRVVGQAWNSRRYGSSKRDLTKPKAVAREDLPVCVRAAQLGCQDESPVSAVGTQAFHDKRNQLFGYFKVLGRV